MDFSNQLIQVLDELGKRFGVMVDWSQQNIMPYASDLAERIIKFEIATSWAWIVLMVFVTIVCITLCIIGTTKDWNDEFVGALGFATMILIILTVGVVLCQVDDIITATYLPEKIIIDMMQGYLQ